MSEQYPEFDPEAAMDAYYAARETAADTGVDDVVWAAFDAHPGQTAVPVEIGGCQCVAVRTGHDEYVVRTAAEHAAALDLRRHLDTIR